MKNITDFSGEEACGFLLEVLDPISEISANKKFMQHFSKGEIMQAAKIALKDNSKAILKLVCVFKGIDEKDINTINPLDILECTMRILSDQQILQVFTSRA